jgi:fatty-acyl-CoA synthase
LSFLPRSAAVYPEHTAVVHGPVRTTWAEGYRRCRRLASALARRGIGLGDTVAVMAPNTPPLFEAHFGVPVLGAVLNALNTRLDAAAIAFILEHGQSKLLITDTEYATVMKEALEKLGRKIPVVDIVDPQGPGGERLGELDYEAFLAEGDPEHPWSLPDDEWRAISLNYTSGTTGNPKGVVYHHRGAYLNAIGNILTWGIRQHPVYLWTLPMFHCNGWCFPWTVTAMAGTNVCLRRVESAAIYQAFAENGVTHLCGAPIVMQMVLGASPEEQRPFSQQVRMMTAAAPPPASVLAAMAEKGIEVTHVYGLTESYGPAVVCAWHGEWDELPIEQQAAMKSRQGVTYPVLEDLMVADAETLEPVPRDGETMGEIFMRGNIVMKGYLKNARRRDHGRDLHARQHRHEGLSEEPGGQRGNLPRRLVPLGRPRGLAPGRLHSDQGPLQGRHHLGRRKHLLDRGRGHALQAPGRGRRRRGRQAGREVGRDTLRLRRAEAAGQGHGRGDHRLLPRQPCPLQMPARRRLRTHPQDVDRQDPEVPPARQGPGDVIRRLLLVMVLVAMPLSQTQTGRPLRLLETCDAATCLKMYVYYEKARPPLRAGESDRLVSHVIPLNAEWTD